MSNVTNELNLTYGWTKLHAPKKMLFIYEGRKQSLNTKDFQIPRKRSWHAILTKALFNQMLALILVQWYFEAISLMVLFTFRNEAYQERGIFCQNTPITKEFKLLFVNDSRVRWPLKTNLISSASDLLTIECIFCYKKRGNVSLACMQSGNIQQPEIQLTVYFKTQDEF